MHSSSKANKLLVCKNNETENTRAIIILSLKYWLKLTGNTVFYSGQFVLKKSYSRNWVQRWVTKSIACRKHLKDWVCLTAAQQCGQVAEAQWQWHLPVAAVPPALLQCNYTAATATFLVGARGGAPFAPFPFLPQALCYATESQSQLRNFLKHF